MQRKAPLKAIKVTCPKCNVKFYLVKPTCPTCGLEHGIPMNVEILIGGESTHDQ